MKKIFIFVLLGLITIGSTSPVFAQEKKTHTVLPQTETFEGDYFAGDDTVTMLGTINGDAYVAGGTVTIDGTVNGDVIAAGGTVIIKGHVQNVRVMGGQVIIHGIVDRNITAFGGNVTLAEDAKLAGSIVGGGSTLSIDAPVGKGATLTGGTVIINNVVNGNVWAGVGELTMQPQGKINGNLVYVSQEKAQIVPGATISGSMTQTIPEKKREHIQRETFLGITDATLFFKAIHFVSLLVIGLLLITLAPNYVKRVNAHIVQRPGKSILVGLATVLAMPIVLFILLVTIVGIPLALIATALFAIVLYLAKFFVILLVGEKVAAWLKFQTKPSVMFLIGLVLYELVTFIPIVGGLAAMAALLFGLGSVMLQKKALYTHLRKTKEI